MKYQQRAHFVTMLVMLAAGNGVQTLWNILSGGDPMIIMMLGTARHDRDRKRWSLLRVIG